MNEIYCGDIRDIAKTLPDQSVNCIVTSPPYFGLRDYGVDKQIGLEETPEAYVNTLVGIFRKLKRVLRDDGTVWLNLGDSYATTPTGSFNGGGYIFRGRDVSGHITSNKVNKLKSSNLKPKNLIGIPWRVAFALQADGWILRSDIIWHKKNPMPESVTDRPTKAHEYIFLLSKKPRYYYDNEAVREAHQTKNLEYEMKKGSKWGHKIKLTAKPNADAYREDTHSYHPNGRNRRTVWTVSTRPYKAAHFAVFPPDLIRPCILAGCPQQVCVECGKPWVRITKKGMTAHDGQTDSQYLKGTTANRLALLRQSAREQGGEYVNTTETIGFEPACQCNAPSCPGVVLDPFMGSGTVAQVAIETGRNWLGVELNPEYIELANKRIAQTQPALPIEITL